MRTDSNFSGLARWRFVHAALVLAVSLAGSGVADAAFDRTELTCRKTVGKQGSKLVRAVGGTLARCHKSRDRLGGGIMAGVDCNTVSAASDAKGKVAKAEAKLRKLVGGASDKCAGVDPEAVNYNTCPAPCSSIGAIVGFTDVADCMICLGRAHVESMTGTAAGTPATLPLGPTDQRCHGILLKTQGKQASAHLRARMKCQTRAEKKDGATDTVTCAGATETKITRAYEIGTSRIEGDCAAADLLAVDSCDTQASGAASCTLDGAASGAQALFLAFFPDPQLATLAVPLLFVTQVPSAAGFTTSVSTFGNHSGVITAAPRGGDLWIRYSDETLRNLTSEAGYGNAGLQGAGAIAVRDPAVHWSGTKALFSMVIGAPPLYQHLEYFWQIYEVTGFGLGETVAITKLANQPESFNNVNAIYGSDDRVIFISDRPRTGESHLYPQLDEYESAITNTGLWSLDPGSGDLFQLNHSPSGSFDPLIDSFGRLVFTRWDHLQRDQQADAAREAGPSSPTTYFNWSSEDAASTPLAYEEEFFPEPREQWINFVAGNPGYSGDPAGYEPHLVGNTINHFFPWTLQQDGREEETLNHIGRHELLVYSHESFNDDPSLEDFMGAAPHVANTNAAVNLFQIAEDPLSAGDYYAIRAPEFGSHASGQLVRIDGTPGVDGDAMTVTYVTHPDTAALTTSPSVDHSGLYRDPLILGGTGGIVAAHTDATRSDTNAGTRADPQSYYDFRLKLVESYGVYSRASLAVNPAIVKQISYYDPDVLVTWDGPLWQLQPAAVVARSAPAAAAVTLPAPEAQVIADEGLTEGAVEAWLEANGLALLVSRDVTTRDAGEKQQPFNLRIDGTATQTTGDAGILYDVAYMQFFQGDQLRSSKNTSSGVITQGRRVIGVPMHDPAVMNPPTTGPVGSVLLGDDGSMAALVPARRAMSWQLTDGAGDAVVRERYWISFQPGEIRVCASCHGINSRDQAGSIAPVNEPEALRALLQYLQGLGEL